jgi:hypothetical protein
MRELKYVNFTDTDIDSILSSFEIIKKSALDVDFKKYINTYYKKDQEQKEFIVEDIVKFCNQVINFINTKQSKLRVKTNLKLNKQLLFSSIFPEDYNMPENLKFWLGILFDYNFSKYEIYEDIENMEDTYKNMYCKYIMEQDKLKFDSD